MRKLGVIIVVFCLSGSVGVSLFSCQKAFGAEITRAEIGIAFTPPHNEPIVQDMVARYKIEADGSVRVWKFTLDGNVKAWFLQNWRTPDAVGHGFPDAWRGSDWNFERVRVDYNVKVGVDVYGRWQAFVEHNKWGYLSRSVPQDHVSEYYWMTGVRYKFR